MHLLFVSIVCVVLAIVALQLLFLLAQFIGSLLPDRSTDQGAPHRARCAVIVPAHNERGGILDTVAALKAQLNPADRLIVVADNCSDETAALAAGAGAEAIERNDLTRIGKGYALDFGIKHLADGPPPEVVVCMDADCIPAPGCVSRIVNLASGRDRPVQGKYLMHATGTSKSARMAEFTYLIKNDVRPTGGARFDFPCLLHGTAMALPWPLISRSKLATGSITEDLKLAIDLCLEGYPALFCPQAQCDSNFPDSERGMRTQQTRWQHGYFSSMVEYMPRLLARAITEADWRLLIIALDLSIPPLALMLVITAMISVLGAIALLFGVMKPLAALATLYFPTLAGLIFLMWLIRGRDLVSFADLVRSVGQIITRVTMLWTFMIRPQREWVRTERKEDQ